MAVQQIMMPQNIVAGGGTDPYIAYRKTIANLNVDLSDPFRTWTANGGAAVTGGALVLDGTGDYLSSPQSTDFDFGSGDFCVESFINVAVSPSAEATILAKWSGSDLSWLFGITSARQPFFYYNSSTTGLQFPTGTGVAPTGTDTHIAAYRVGTQLYMAVGGNVSASSALGTDALVTVSVQSCIGAQSDGISSLLNGKIKGVRATKGSSGGYGASNFTPPSFPLPTS